MVRSICLMSDPVLKSAGQPQSNRLLTSWKEIADVLGVSARTAQTYEKTLGLPVRRDGTRVAAFEQDLRDWQLQRYKRPAREPEPVRPRWRLAAGFGLAVLIIVAAIWLWRTFWAVGQPATASWSGRTLTAVDSHGRPVWRREFPLPVENASFTPWVGDLDSDSIPETVTPYPHINREAEGWDLYCFSSKGATRWKMSVEATVSNQSRTFTPPYVLRGFVTFPSPEMDGSRWTAAVFVHHTMNPSVLLVVDAKGRRRGEFWQAGHMNYIHAADLDGDGITELLVAGIQEIPAQAVLLILDPRKISGVAQAEPKDNPVQLTNMAPGTEKAVVYFPRTALSRKLAPFDAAGKVEMVGSLIQVSVSESIDGAAYLIYSLTRDLAVADLVVPPAFESVVRQQGPAGAKLHLGQEEIEDLKRQVRVVRR